MFIRRIDNINTNKLITLISLFLVSSFLFYFLTNIKLTILLINEYKHWDLSTFEYFAPIILLPISLSFFLLKRKTGWVITFALLVYFLLTSAYHLLLEFSWGILQIKNIDYNFTFTPFFPAKNIILYIIQILGILVIIYLMNKLRVKKIYDVKTRTSILTSVITLIFFIGILGIHYS